MVPYAAYETHLQGNPQNPETVAAQPQEVPAEQRELRIQVEHEISNRLATLLLAKEVGGSEFDFISAVKLLARELDHTVQPESPNADIPESK